MTPVQWEGLNALQEASWCSFASSLSLSTSLSRASFYLFQDSSSLRQSSSPPSPFFLVLHSHFRKVSWSLSMFRTLLECLVYFGRVGVDRSLVNRIMSPNMLVSPSLSLSFPPLLPSLLRLPLHLSGSLCTLYLWGFFSLQWTILRMIPDLPVSSKLRLDVGKLIPSMQEILLIACMQCSISWRAKISTFPFCSGPSVGTTQSSLLMLEFGSITQR